jgi:hypothetical protein
MSATQALAIGRIEQSVAVLAFLDVIREHAVMRLRFRAPLTLLQSFASTACIGTPS